MTMTELSPTTSLDLPSEYVDAAVDRALGFDGVDSSVLSGAAFGQVIADA